MRVTDGQTDGRTERHTSCDGIIRAMHTHRAINKLSYKHGRPKTDLGLLNITWCKLRLLPLYSVYSADGHILSVPRSWLVCNVSECDRAVLSMSESACYSNRRSVSDLIINFADDERCFRLVLLRWKTLTEFLSQKQSRTRREKNWLIM